MRDNEYLCWNCGAYNPPAPQQPLPQPQPPRNPQPQGWYPAQQQPAISKPAKGLPRRVIAIVVAVLVVAGGGTAAFVALKNRGPAPPPSGGTLPNGQPAYTEKSTKSSASKKGRVTNVTSPEFELSDDFIVPVVRQTTVPEGYIGISTAEEFDKIRLNKAGNYILMGDIDLALILEWEPIDSFKGILDGNGFTVKNVKRGILGDLFSAEVRNLKAVPVANIDDSVFRNGLWYAIIAERVFKNSIIDNCSVGGKIKIDLRGTAGVFISCIAVSAESSIISNCLNVCDVEIIVPSRVEVNGFEVISGLDVGGIVCTLGQDVKIFNSFNQGNISISSQKFFGYSLGGIVGDVYNGNNATIESCRNDGSIKVTNNLPAVEREGRAHFSAGGIAGGKVAGLGGTVLEISNCVNNADITVNSSGLMSLCSVAGILATDSISRATQINNCYNVGNINISVDFDFSLMETMSITIGQPNYSINGIADRGDIKTCYNKGGINISIPLTGESYTRFVNMGGIVGWFKDVEYCYFLNNVESATPDGALFANVKKLTDAEMQKKASYVGFDFDSIWEMGKGDYPYPVFKARYE